VLPFLREARELGCKIMLDTSLGDVRERDAVIECVTLADIFVPNSDELLRLTGGSDLDEAVASAVSWGTQLVVTRGKDGALVAGPDGSVVAVSDGIRDVAVRDLTGAGDSFAGAMIAALIGGASVAEAAVEANVAGSEAVGRLGGVGEVGAAGTGAGWPLRPMVVKDVTTALAAAMRPGATDQG
jgi:2-dehydro-3-deoxygluconokinase